MPPWLMEHFQEIALAIFVVVVLILNRREKPEPDRDLKTPEYKSLDQRFKDAYRRAIFGDDTEE